MWIDLIPKDELRNFPHEKIEPPLRLDLEMRIIIYETKDCVFKQELSKCNDLYVRGGLAN